jgi:hypothetical protein
VVRDLAVAADALRARGLQLDVLLLDDGREGAALLDDDLDVIIGSRCARGSGTPG